MDPTPQAVSRRSVAAVTHSFVGLAPPQAFVLSPVYCHSAFPLSFTLALIAQKATPASCFFPVTFAFSFLYSLVFNRGEKSALKYG